MIKIPKEEICKRMVEWRNYKKLFPKAQAKRDELKIENQELKRKVKELEKENKQIEKLQLQLEELRAMKFGKRRDKPGQSVKNLLSNKKKFKKRSKESYRRKEPTQDQITDYLHLEIKTCPECGNELTEKKEHIHYREDLYEVEELLKSAQKIVKTIVESGKCQACRKRQYVMEIPKQKVSIGPNIRMMLVFLIVVQGQSYTEAKRSLEHQYGIELSSGEIANILEGESNLMIPCYNHLAEELENKAAHYDETSWKTRNGGKKTSEGNYCWTKIAVESENRLIWFGKSRGKRVAEKLRGKKKGSIGITDDYCGYEYTFDYQQLCWSHPHRKLRDLAGSRSLSKKPKKVCRKAYKNWRNVYKRAEKVRLKLLAGAWTEEEKIEKQAKLEKLFEKMFEGTPADPEKLKIMRQTLKKRKKAYFTFFKFPYLPLDNNKAERSLRKIVLKRKKSFGCQSQKGADVLSILYSVIFSFMGANPDKNFFHLYSQALEFKPLSE